MDLQEAFFAEERKQKILEMISMKEKVTVGELVGRFKVSSATIRNDLRQMGHSGQLLRTHGGAILIPRSGFEPESTQKEVTGIESSREIAACALEQIDSGDTLVLDTGVATLELARLLYARRNLVVVTNDIRIAAVLEDAEAITVILLGGTLKRGAHASAGPHAKSMLMELAVDKAFLCVQGLNAAKGATVEDVNLAEMKKAMMTISGRHFFLCESVKLGKSAFVQFAETDRLGIVITDKKADPSAVKGLEEAGVQVILA